MEDDENINEDGSRRQSFIDRQVMAVVLLLKKISLVSFSIKLLLF